MHDPTVNHLTDELYERAKAIVIEAQSVSVSLIQRHLRLGYSTTLTIMEKLETEGIVTVLDESNARKLTNPYLKNQTTDIRMNSNLTLMLDKFDGCEGGDPGSPASPTIWLFGIEPGWSKLDQASVEPPSNPMDDGYSIDTQLQWSYNKNAFKLLCAIKGFPVSQYLEFATEHQPFVQGSKGYFKGNIYPYACNNLAAWPDDAREETGFESKDQYQEWCAEHRWPAIKRWVDEHQPELFIGVGNTLREEFSQSVFGRSADLDCQVISVNGHNKKIYFGQAGGLKLVVIPHISRGSNGLNSDEAIEKAGALIRTFMDS